MLGGIESGGRADSLLIDMASVVVLVWQAVRQNEVPWTKSLARVHY